jgi:hypothetical protein
MTSFKVSLQQLYETLLLVDEFFAYFQVFPPF